MATIVNNPGDQGGSSAGWAVAVIILIVVVAGGIFWYMRYHQAPAQGGSATVQVNLPAGGNSGGSNQPAQ
ncbi:MAG TPA: hypothetical protein VGP13_03655 [Candidatus Paceibacterota bacterium]|nr:hypothetical protein [Candidatus Paceibacterota bacterium]